MSETRLPPWTPTQERLGSMFVKLMTAANTWVYRLTDGRVWGTFLRGAPVCLVTAIGRKSSEPRTIALLYLADGDDVIIVASKGGMSKNPLWYGNMIANPDVELQIGSTRLRGRARVVDDEREAAAIRRRFTERYLLARLSRWFGGYTRSVAVVVERLASA